MNLNTYIYSEYLPRLVALLHVIREKLPATRSQIEEELHFELVHVIAIVELYRRFMNPMLEEFIALFISAYNAFVLNPERFKEFLLEVGRVFNSFGIVLADLSNPLGYVAAAGLLAGGAAATAFGLATGSAAAASTTGTTVAMLSSAALAAGPPGWIVGGAVSAGAGVALGIYYGARWWRRPPQLVAALGGIASV